MDGRFVQTSIQSDSEEKEEKEKEQDETQTETDQRKESTPARYTSTEVMETSFDITPPTQIRRGRKMLIRERAPGENNLKLYVDRMNNQQLDQAIEAITENATTITKVVNIGNNNQN